MNGELLHIKLEKVHINLIDSQIVENYVLKGSEIKAEDLMEVKQQNLILTKNQKYCVLIVTNEFVTFTKAARELLAGNKIANNTLAYAILLNNFAQKMIGNFYLSINKPQTPTLLFYDRKKAIDWLYLQLKKNNEDNS